MKTKHIYLIKIMNKLYLFKFQFRILCSIYVKIGLCIVDKYHLMCSEVCGNCDSDYHFSVWISIVKLILTEFGIIIFTFDSFEISVHELIQID